jgi:hypothetical protein
VYAIVSMDRSAEVREWKWADTVFDVYGWFVLGENGLDFPGNFEDSMYL